MGADGNIKLIQSIYEAFGRGDVSAVLDGLADEVDWATDTASSAAPWYGVRNDKVGVAAFFQAFGSTMEVEEFTPNAFAANDTEVFSVVRCRTKVRATGKPVDMNLHHYFVLRDSKIIYYRGTEDTSQVEAALKP